MNTTKPADKGERNGTCNRSVCNNKPAIHFNRDTDELLPDAPVDYFPEAGR